MYMSIFIDSQSATMEKAPKQLLFAFHSMKCFIYHLSTQCSECIYGVHG